MENRKTEAVAMLNRENFIVFFIMLFVVLLLFDLLRICKNHSGLCKLSITIAESGTGC